MITRETTLDLLREQLGEAVLGTTEFRGETSVTIPKEALLKAAWVLWHNGYLQLLDLTAVDHYGAEPRFLMVYEFYHLAANTHLRLKTELTEDEPTVNSLTSLYQTANWHEREAYDLMGIQFTGHPDLRRILMWEGYPFHPLRKDFPLEGLDSAAPQAFTRTVPLEGGPFVTQPSNSSHAREPRSHAPNVQ